MWYAVFGAWCLISVSPGAGAVASMSTGMRFGLGRGYWNIVGLELGLLLQLVVVAAGLGALLANSTHAFTVIKWFGVAYLVYLGIRQWRASATDTPDGGGETGEASGPAMVLRGFLVNASNPKATVVMLAVIPQFITLHESLLPQYAIIAITMIAVDMAVMIGYTGLASRVLTLMRLPRQQRATNRTFSGLFFVAATLLATVRHAV